MCIVDNFVLDVTWRGGGRKGRKGREGERGLWWVSYTIYELVGQIFS